MENCRVRCDLHRTLTGISQLSILSNQIRLYWDEQKRRDENRIPPYKDIHSFVGCGAIFTAPLQAFHHYQSPLTNRSDNQK
jgi:hypothetical protein